VCVCVCVVCVCVWCETNEGIHTFYIQICRLRQSRFRFRSDKPTKVKIALAKKHAKGVQREQCVCVTVCVSVSVCHTLIPIISVQSLNEVHTIITAVCISLFYCWCIGLTTCHMRKFIVLLQASKFKQWLTDTIDANSELEVCLSVIISHNVLLAFVFLFRRYLKFLMAFVAQWYNTIIKSTSVLWTHSQQIQYRRMKIQIL